jgi:dephospho-CoA kinase
MKLFGLTGGIGMGKSTAAKILSERGIPVADTDLLARQVVERGQPALEEIHRAFGDAVIAPDGSLQRAALARIVFSDPAARQKLESITHPRIRQLWREQVEIWRARQAPVGCVVIPLLFETGAEKELDATICVACSPGTQQKRLRERGWTPEQIGQRIAAQFPAEKKIAMATLVAWNEGSLEVLAAQLERIVLVVERVPGGRVVDLAQGKRVIEI